MPNSKIVLLLTLLLGVSYGAQAQSIHYTQPPTSLESDFDDKQKNWSEITALFPAAPKAENLLPFIVSPAATQIFALDAKSLSIGIDGVIRYTLVTTSRAGAENISYEGIRCQSLEQKIYAFGHKDGTWSRSRRDQWTPINDRTINRQQAALALDFFCYGSQINGNAEQILEKIKWKKPASIRDVKGGGL